MELRDIEYFAVIAEQGHLGRAAEALGLSQSALSKSLRRLESALQAKLVKRTPKGVELTPEGSVVFLRMRELQLSLQGLVREVAEVGEGRVGHLRIGVGFPIGIGFPQDLLASAFATLLKDAPRTSLIVTVSDNDVMVPALRNGELDLIFNVLRMTGSPEGLVHEHLYDDEQVVWVAAGHRLLGRKHLTLADLAKERWAVSALAQASQQKLHDAFRNAGLPPPNIAIECRSPSLYLRTVAQSEILGWMQLRFVEQSDLASKLKILPVKELAWRRPVGLIYRKESYLPPAIGRFIKIAKACAKNIAPLR